MGCMQTIERPRSVVAATVIAWVEGEVTILGGALVLTFLDRENDDFLQSLSFGVAFSTIAVGLVTVFIAGGLLSGGRFARIATTVLMAISVIVGVLGVLIGQTVFTVTAALAIATVCLLWLGPARGYFRASRAAAARRYRSRQRATPLPSPAQRH
jgi:hypothetical protein